MADDSDSSSDNEEGKMIIHSVNLRFRYLFLNEMSLDWIRTKETFVIHLYMVLPQFCFAEENEITRKSALERWRDSLLTSTSLSQVFLHLAVLDGCIVWAKSFLHARCRLCRRKGDAEKMLLCDGCDRGHHMYCLKPPMKVWTCIWNSRKIEFIYLQAAQKKPTKVFDCVWKNTQDT